MVAKRGQSLKKNCEEYKLLRYFTFESDRMNSLLERILKSSMEIVSRKKETDESDT